MGHYHISDLYDKGVLNMRDRLSQKEEKYLVKINKQVDQLARFKNMNKERITKTGFFDDSNFNTYRMVD